MQFTEVTQKYETVVLNEDRLIPIHSTTDLRVYAFGNMHYYTRYRATRQMRLWCQEQWGPALLEYRHGSGTYLANPDGLWWASDDLLMLKNLDQCMLFKLAWS